MTMRSRPSSERRPRARHHPPNRRGLPIGVERWVTLSRRLTDEEWERLVVELREVFKARGRTQSDGSLRQWPNGNLYALLEPVPGGQRLRVGSLNGAARARITAGGAGGGS